MKHTCGITVVEKKVKPGKEDRVSDKIPFYCCIYFVVFRSFIIKSNLFFS